MKKTPNTGMRFVSIRYFNEGKRDKEQVICFHETREEAQREVLEEQDETCKTGFVCRIDTVWECD
jgi:hypothetical protein